MGTCPSANVADHDARAKPLNAIVESGPERSERGRKDAHGLILRGDPAGGGNMDAVALQSTLLAGVQRWCMDVSEWGELSADQVRQAGWRIATPGLGGL